MELLIPVQVDPKPVVPGVAVVATYWSELPSRQTFHYVLCRVIAPFRPRPTLWLGRVLNLIGGSGRESNEVTEPYPSSCGREGGTTSIRKDLLYSLLLPGVR